MDIQDSNRVQLKLLAEIVTLLDEAELDFWLRGGWALDFLLDDVTRSHSDIDLVAWKRDTDIIKQLFVDADYKFLRNMGVQMDFAKSKQDISVVFIGKNDTDEVYTPDIPDWVWLDNALYYTPQTLENITYRVISPEQLLDNKLSYERATGRPPRAKDHISITLLRNLLASQQSEP